MSQFVVFSSILDSDVRKAVAAEMLRVLRPGGLVLWYDFHRDNPRNPDVTGIRKSEVERLFPGCSIELRPATVAPPLARSVGARLPWALGVLGAMSWLKTHHVGIIVKR